jgi:FAD/FMN-containing dehydrogenase
MMTPVLASTMDVLSSVSFDKVAISRLQESMRGSVLLPGHEQFDAAWQTWIVGFQHSPAVIVLPESADDVVAAVSFANEHDLNVSIQGAAHGPTVPNIGGMLINTKRMQGVTVDPVARIARVEAGVKWLPVVQEAHKYGLAPLNGSSTDVGVVGYSLGGGTGWLARKYGFAADAIRSADVVTAEGYLIHVSPESHADLFWALRGGGGNFGVVVALEFELFPVPTFFGGAIFYPMAEAPEVFKKYARWTQTAPEEITSSIALFRFPPLPFLPEPLQGKEVVSIRATALGPNGEELVAPLRMMGTPIMDIFEERPYDQIDIVSSDPVDPMPHVATSAMLNELSPEAIASLMRVGGPETQNPLLMIEIRHIAGAATRKAIDSSVANRHDVPFLMFAAGVPMGPESTQALFSACDELDDALKPFASEKIFLNFQGDTSAEGARNAYREEHYSRLQEIKAKYDPANRFRFNINIAPASK